MSLNERSGLSRRVLLTRGLTALATPAIARAGLGSGAVLATTQLAYAARTHQFTMGDTTVTVVSDGVLNLPASRMATPEDVDKVSSLLAMNGRDPVNRQSQINCVVLQDGTNTILVDTGGGGVIAPTTGELVDSLGAVGIAPEDVTHVLFTHAHPDHINGHMVDGSNRYANATFIMHENEAGFWMDPEFEFNMPEGLHGLHQMVVGAFSPVEDRMERVQDGHEVVSGVSFMATHGHTPGHSSILVSKGSEQLLIVGDAITHDLVSFEHPDWAFAFDLDKPQAAATRKRMLDMIATDKMKLIGYHLLWPGLGTAEVMGNAYRYVAVS